MPQQHSSIPAESPRAATAFGCPTIDLTTLASQQGVEPMTDSTELTGDFWPDDESCDEFLEEIRQLRRAGGTRVLP